MFENKKTHIKGLLGELEFATYLIKKGWSVFTPLDHNSRIDMIIEKDGKIQRIQIKYCTPKRGCLKIDLEHRIRNTKPFTKYDIDAIGAFDPINNKFYIVPFDKIYPRKGIWIRISGSGNKQTKGINWGKDFEV